MSNDHSGSVFEAEGGYFQALCVCGWLSTVSYFEEVDLLRALHAHQVTVFNEAEAEEVLLGPSREVANERHED